MPKQLLDQIDFNIKAISKAMVTYCGLAILVAGIATYVVGTINKSYILIQNILWQESSQE